MTLSTILQFAAFFFLFVGVPGGALRALVDREQRVQGMRISVKSMLAFVVLFAAGLMLASQGL